MNNNSNNGLIMKTEFYLTYSEMINIVKDQLSKNHGIEKDDIDVHFKVPENEYGIDVHFKVPENEYDNSIIKIDTEEERSQVILNMKEKIDGGQLFNAMKYFRSATGCWLKEAQNIVRNKELWDDFIVNGNFPKFS